MEGTGGRRYEPGLCRSLRTPDDLGEDRLRQEAAVLTIHTSQERYDAIYATMGRVPSRFRISKMWTISTELTRRRKRILSHEGQKAPHNAYTSGAKVKQDDRPARLPDLLQRYLHRTFSVLREGQALMFRRESDAKDAYKI